MKKILVLFLAICSFSILLFSETREKPKIAIVPFTVFASGIAQNYADIITNSIIASISNLKTVTVVDRTSLDFIFKEAKLSMSGIVNGDQAIGIGKLKGADYIIVGKLYDLSGYSNVRDKNAGYGKDATAYAPVSWRMYRVSDGTLVQQFFEIYSNGAHGEISEVELTDAAKKYTLEKAGSEIAKKVTELFPIETKIAAFKKFDKSDRYAESVYLPLGPQDGLYEDQKLFVGNRFMPNRNDIIYFGLLEIDKFENGLALADIDKGEKFVKIDSINSTEGTSPYMVRSGFSGLMRTNRAAISILPFTGNVQNIYKETLYELLSSYIFNSYWFTMPDRGKVSEVVKEKNLQLSGIVSESDLQKAGQSIGVDAVLIVNIDNCSVSSEPLEYKPWEPRYSAEFSISGRLVSVATGQILCSGTFGNSSNTGQLVGKLLLGSLGILSGPTAKDKYEALIRESSGPFGKIITSMFGVYPMEDSVIAVTLDDGEIDKLFLPFGYADGISTQMDNVKFLMFEKEDFMGKIRETPIAKLEIDFPLDYHLSCASIDDKLIKGKIDVNKKYHVRLIVE